MLEVNDWQVVGSSGMRLGVFPVIPRVKVIKYRGENPNYKGL